MNGVSLRKFPHGHMVVREYDGYQEAAIVDDVATVEGAGTLLLVRDADDFFQMWQARDVIDVGAPEEFLDLSYQEV